MGFVVKIKKNSEPAEPDTDRIRHRWRYDWGVVRVYFPRQNTEQPSKQTFDRRSKNAKSHSES
jgi:hypothetical protein